METSVNHSIGLLGCKRTIVCSKNRLYQKRVIPETLFWQHHELMCVFY